MGCSNKGSIAQEGFWNYRQSGSPYEGQLQVQACRAHVRRGSHTWSLHLTIVVYLTRAKGDTSSPRGAGTWNTQGESEGLQRWKWFRHLFVPSFKKHHVPLREGQADKQLGFIVNQAGYRRLYREQMMSRSTLHIKQKENQNDTHGRRRHSCHLFHQFPKRWAWDGLWGPERTEQIWTCTLNVLKD